MRQRVNGFKFEDEFEKTMSRKVILTRLHTPNTKYSGLTQPADFILIGNSTSYVETKETGKDAFSIASMEQLDEMLKYLKIKKALSSTKPGIASSSYFIIVHFIGYKIIKVITAEYAFQLLTNKKRLSVNDNKAYSFNNLKELGESTLF